MRGLTKFGSFRLFHKPVLRGLQTEASPIKFPNKKEKNPVQVCLCYS